MTHKFGVLCAGVLAAAVMSGCGTKTGTASGGAGPSSTATALAGTRWQLVQFQSSDDAIGVIKPPDASRYTLELNAEGRLAMQLDCNRASGQWEAKPNSETMGSITFNAAAVTSAACAAGSMDTRIARDLGSVRSYVLQGDKLHLALKIDSGIYTWSRLRP